MEIGMLGTSYDRGYIISNGDCGAVNRLLRQLNPKAPERTRADLESRLNRINRNGGVAIVRDANGNIVAMGTWTVIPTLMRTTAFASEVSFDQGHPEWQRFLKELLRYFIGRAKEAGAERIDLTWNKTRPGYEIFLDLGFTEPDTRSLRLIF
ncbi:MAG: hypothetical protein A3A44_00280 [Candidatus Sungbacteria bacterium RIFCSPLOWO2_01_FULL_60_25]|uniref:N-acetyltransferase domain-containing protein n=1 Tax=Candidatus Sungbacteria bacterium RIFCSPLOWO2_01_FULL_60_25 TaxID=1802281 RepID=A0A1G2L9W9_9BACT|nr:MAG: hypothetical protein A3A44_00280 [Candidatus Sungbacteria bacterium RIFCSPLOWO2_01_FULL_60_25]